MAARTRRVGRTPGAPAARGNQRVRAVELAPEVAAPFLEAGLRPVMGAPVFGSSIAGWYEVDRGSTADDYVASARRQPPFRADGGRPNMAGRRSSGMK